MRNRLLTLSLCICMATVFNGCGNDDAKDKSKSAEDNKELAKYITSYQAEYSDSDKVPEWEKGNTSIKLEGDSVEISGAGASYEDSKIKITKAGYYVLYGTLNDGQIVIDADKKDKIYLVLNGVQITCKSDAVLNEKKADKVIVTLVDGTENAFVDSEARTDENISAAIYCKDSLTINGSGTLLITANYNDGIASKDKVKVIDAQINVVSKDDGIVGKDIVSTKNATLTIESQGDGIKSTKSDDTEKGIVYIDGGVSKITSEKDGISAENFVKIENGDLSILSGGGNENGVTKKNDFGGMKGGFGDKQFGGKEFKDREFDKKFDNKDFTDKKDFNDEEFDKFEMTTDENGNPQMPQRGERPNMPEGMEDGNMPNMPQPAEGMEGGDMPQPPEGMNNENMPQSMENNGTLENQNSDTESTSKKGIKGKNGIYIVDGNITIDSADDAIHSNNITYIAGGNIDILSGDDGVHADTLLEVSGGTINIQKSYEGLEAHNINVKGGEISLVASDDGLNAAGGNDGSSVNGRPGQNGFGDVDSTAKIEITGGSINVTASGDGIDSNGEIVMSSGKVVVSGPVSGGNGILDYGTSFTMNGGELYGAGTSSMFQSTSTTSKLAVINIQNITGNANEEIVLYDGSEVIGKFNTNTSYQAMIISNEKLVSGKEYTLSCAGTETGVTATEPVDYSGMGR